MRSRRAVAAAAALRRGDGASPGGLLFVRLRIKARGAKRSAGAARAAA